MIRVKINNYNIKIVRRKIFFGRSEKVFYWGFSVPLKRSLIWLMKKSSSLLVTVAHGRQCRTGSTNPIRWNWNRFRWPRIGNKCKISCLRKWSIHGLILYLISGFQMKFFVIQRNLFWMSGKSFSRNFTIVLFQQCKQ